MYHNLNIEISGFCNAKCPWCVTGNGGIPEEKKKFMTAHDFSNILDTLISNKIISGRANIGLYIIGEPFLNPELIDIIRIICDRGCTYSLSTNASKYTKIPKELEKNLVSFIISMPGFSQESYSRIHNFSFNKIQENVKKFISDISPVKITVNYHIYQFNVKELEEAYRFFSQYGVHLSPNYAYIQDYDLARKYLAKTLKDETSSKASEELILDYVEKFLSEMPPDYECPLWNSLTIDEWGNITTCCYIPKGHQYYSKNNLQVSDDLCFESITNTEIPPMCDQCRKSGIPYWACNPQKPECVETYDKKYFIKNISARYLRIINERDFQSMMIMTKNLASSVIKKILGENKGNSLINKLQEAYENHS